MLMYISTGLCEHFHVDSLEMTRQSIFLRFFFPFQLAVFPSNIFFFRFSFTEDTISITNPQTCWLWKQLFQMRL